MVRTRTARRILGAVAGVITAMFVALSPQPTSAKDATIVKADTQIDGLDPGIKIFMREKMAHGNTRFSDDNVVLFLHGATAPSTCDFDLTYKDYSWADWMVKRGYVLYMGDYRNYGYSTREKTMDQPASANPPVTRSYLALRDIEAMVDHVKRTRGVRKVTLIGWSWGAMMAGYYASLHSENVHKLVLYAPLQFQRPHQSRPGQRAAEQAQAARIQFRARRLSPGVGGGEYRPLERRNPRRQQGRVPRGGGPGRVLDGMHGDRPEQQHAQSAEPARAERRAGGFVLSGHRTAAVERVEYLCAKAGHRRPVRHLVVSRGPRGLMRDLVHAPVKRSVLIPNATHFVLFEKHRMEFFEAILKFLKE